MSFLLEKAAGRFRSIYPRLPWQIRLSYGGQSRSFGNGPERVNVEFRKAAPLLKLGLGNVSGFLDDYVTGDVEFHGDIYAIVGLRRHVPDLSYWGVGPLHRLKYSWSRFFPSSVRRKLVAVSSHYDLPNEFILSYLDKKTKAYSCAMWKDSMNQAFPSDETLEDAQYRKFHDAAVELDLQPDDKFLDIGCGYGYQVHHAETHFGVKKALGITLSQNQVDDGYSKNLALKHYMEVPGDGSWDKIYTCGMISHLNKAEIGQYYRHVYKLLKPGGRVWFHAITPMANAQGLDNYSTVSGTFSQKYVFPDHYQFPEHVHLKIIEETGFLVRKVYFRYGHYAKTLRHWYKRYLENLPQTRHMITPTIERAWHLYLTFGSEIDGHVSVLKQTLCEKPG
ncbi:MAG: class I SAM-dependent methyltransferase [Elusimicrobia bacterium]|nr:class I SAM-dependent methyltransferase [Elusimicrobiota bacterium]